MKRICLILLLSLTVATFAHPGRTDKNGGHHTSKCNHKKGVCYYHYH